MVPIANSQQPIHGGHIIYNDLINRPMEEIVNPSVEILDYPVRDGKILRTYDFILPKFYFAPPWRIFVCYLDIPDFLPRRDM